MKSRGCVLPIVFVCLLGLARPTLASYGDCESLLVVGQTAVSSAKLLENLKHLIEEQKEEIHPGKLFLLERFLPAIVPASEFRQTLIWKKAVLSVAGYEDFSQKQVLQSAKLRLDLGHYDYPQAGPGQRVFHVNFSDPVLFRYWWTGLLAQDEVQVVEHPQLAVWQRILSRQDRDLIHLDTDQQEVALILGVPRLGVLETRSIYGADFWDAPNDILEISSTPGFQGRTDLIAMAARPVRPEMQGRAYRRQDIEYHLKTVLTAFLAARRESVGRELIIHTGNWGCGAFGNNPVMMAMLQIFAASATGVDELVYKTDLQLSDAAKARILVDEFFASDRAKTTAAFLDYVERLGFTYGVGNGT